MRQLGLFLALFALICGHAVFGNDINVTKSSEFQAALNTAAPGDQILLAPGIYPGDFIATGLTGVTIRSVDANNPAVIDASATGEGLKLSSVQHVTVSDLIVENFANEGINIDDGGHIAPSEDVNLSGLLLRNGGAAASEAIKVVGTIGFHLDRVQIVGYGASGTGIYIVGSQNGLVERSYVESTTPGSGDGILAKGGSANVIIRANRLVNANERAIELGGDTANATFRPQPPGNVEASGIIAEGNVIVNSGNVGAIQSGMSFVNVADGTFRNNVVYRPSLYAIRILKENTNPGFVNTQNGIVSDNIFEWNQGDLQQTINAGPNTLPATFHFDGNQWFNATQPSNSFPSLPSPEVNGIYGVDPHLNLSGITPWDFAWGKWLVNTSKLSDTFAFNSGQQYLLAVPGQGSTLDLGAANPLIGDWTLQRINGSQLTVQPFDYEVLLKTRTGDYNGDNVVDMNDYLAWQQSFGSTSSLLADGNGDGVVDAADYTVWRNAFAAAGVPPAAAATVCEPGSGVLVAIALLFIAALRQPARVPDFFVR
jgi:hypothetical protein